MSYIIGCDIGTTNVKTTAFDSETGAILATHSLGYEMDHPRPDWSEQDPDEIFDALCRCVREVSSISYKHGELLGISFSSAMHSVLAIDSSGKKLTNLIIWADNRSSDIADKLRRSAHGLKIYQNNGTPIHAMTPVCKLLWLKKNKPEIYHSTHKFVGIKEYIIYRLTGNFVVDFSIASATGLFNIREKKWDEWTLKHIGLDEHKLSKAVSPYHQEKLENENAFGVPDGTPLIMGASDGCLANLGSGSINASSIAVTIGTSAATRVCAPEPYLDSKMRTFCYILDEETYVIGGASNNGGVIFEWLKNSFFPDAAFEDVFREAEKVKPASDGLLFFPYLLGERAPLWSSTVRGGFSGLDIQHTKSHFARAVMEGILLNLFSVGEILLSKNDVQTIYANGGFANSSLWVQMLADVFGKKVSLNDTVETGTVGAAMMALKALGIRKEFGDMKIFTPVSVLFKPSARANRAYKKAFEKFNSENSAFAAFS
ncbi:Xylulose kinase [Dyadobacter sp. CECT 9275]|uniref:Xylulose kinase n=1 Tax=Dyadobacter helix TaxID=2822344 RepID=A0A916JC89_9BACT|nr:gluconokinase [Dyadobacter sp. CECT 9275]CAG5003706.1 Xylulose kinase [Dyadobacter sp. CECT 9275]